ncbi:MAG: DUF1348 family protein [Gammaproteobacteria bacterium]
MRERAPQKVSLAVNNWNTRNTDKVASAYMIDSQRRNRAEVSILLKVSVIGISIDGLSG